MGSRGRVGSVIGGKWRVDRQIGRGGTSSVYAAVHAAVGYRVAVKILNTQASQSMKQRDRFLREGKLANRIDHEGVIKIIDNGVTAEGRPYLIMELLEGENLDDRRHKNDDGCLPFDEVIDLTLRVADILAAAHDAGLVHRDVKPSNVFLTRNGGVKLLDFGLAGYRQRDEDKTRTGAGCGTPLFMAPEQLTGDDCIDARADVFALAAMVYRLLSGRYPYAGQSVVEYARSLLMGPTPPRLDTMGIDVDVELANVIATALAIDPKERFADARVFATAVKDAIDVRSKRRETLLLPTPPSSRNTFGQIDTVIMRPQQLRTAPMAPISMPVPPPPSSSPIPTPISSSVPAVHVPRPPKASWLPALIALGLSLGLLVGCASVLVR